MLWRLRLSTDCTHSSDPSCYFTRPAKRWFEARNKCTASNADLAVLTSNIYYNLRSSSKLKANVGYYIGLRNVQLLWDAAGKDSDHVAFYAMSPLFERFNIKSKVISPWATRGPHAPLPQLAFTGILLCIWVYILLFIMKINKCHVKVRVRTLTEYWHGV